MFLNLPFSLLLITIQKVFFSVTYLIMVWLKDKSENGSLKPTGKKKKQLSWVKKYAVFIKPFWYDHKITPESAGYNIEIIFVERYPLS